MVQVLTTQRWRPIFDKFIEPMRIDSKEVAALDERGSPLHLWRSQNMALDFICSCLDDNIRMMMWLKSRQLGQTTLTLVIDFFWLAMYPGTIGALVADDDKNSIANRAKLTRYIDSLPRNFLGDFKCIKNNKNHLLFSNGSRLDFLVAGKSKVNWGEGTGYSLAHLTEASKYGQSSGIDNFMEAFSDTHPNRLLMIESTANGYNHYKTMWEEYGRDQHMKRRQFLGWWAKELNSIRKDDPRYRDYGLYLPNMQEQEQITLVEQLYQWRITPEQLAWYRWRQSNKASSDDSLAQNQPWTASEAFVLTGFSFFQTRVIQQDLDRVIGDDEAGLEPIYFKGYRYHIGEDFFAVTIEEIIDSSRIDEVELRVWEEPVKDAQYVIGADTAFGRNDWKDAHVFSVWRCFADKVVQVAEYASPDPETRQAAWVLAHLAAAYKNCIVNIELGGPGHAVFTEWNSLRNQLKAEMYAEQVKEKKWDDFLDNARWYLYHKPDSMGAGYAYATQATFQLTHRMLNHLRDMYTSRRLVVNSRPMLEEMLIVVQDGSHIGAPKGQGNKDDRVFGAALAVLSYKDWIEQRLVAEGYTYDVAMRAQSGNPNDLPNIVDRMVADYLKRSEEMAGREPEPDKWKSDRGLV